MPSSTIFKDLSITFDKNPVTNDLLVTKNDAAIKRSIYNLILTTPGERFFNPNIGCGVKNLLFEPLDFITASNIRDEIEYTIRAFEPRVSVQQIDVDINDNQNAFEVLINYTIIGDNSNTIREYEFLLEKA